MSATKYQAISQESYNELVAYVINLPTTVTLHPSIRTIVIPDEAPKEIGEFIDDNALDFIISPIDATDDNVSLLADPTTDANTIREIFKEHVKVLKAKEDHNNSVIETLKTERDQAAADKELYSHYWQESTTELDRVKSQVKAISILMSSIFPER